MRIFEKVSEKSQGLLHPWEKSLGKSKAKQSQVGKVPGKSPRANIKPRLLKRNADYWIFAFPRLRNWSVLFKRSQGKFPGKVPRGSSQGKFSGKVPRGIPQGKFPGEVPRESPQGKFPATTLEVISFIEEKDFFLNFLTFSRCFFFVFGGIPITFWLNPLFFIAYF